MMNMVMNILIRVPTPATSQIHQHITKGIKVKDPKKEKPNKNQKRLLGLYKLPTKSKWNDGMTESEKRDFIDSIIKELEGS